MQSIPLYSILTGILTGILSSLVASYVWFYLFSQLKPKIEIAPKIAKYVNGNGETKFKIKVINRTKYDVNIEAKLYVVRIENGIDGDIYIRKKIPLIVDKLFLLKRFDKNDSKDEYAFRFLLKKDIDRYWQSDTNQRLRFCIYAKHSLSGFGESFVQEYRKKNNDIQAGDFMIGDTFEIK